MAIVIRKDLNISNGKMFAQVAHAIKRSDGHADYAKERVICITLLCNTGVQLQNLHEKCLSQGVAHGLQVDAGINELEPNTPTVLCVGPDDPEKVDKITKRLRLYND